jgi:hypothetical protein
VFLDKTIQELNEHVKGCIAELVFNLDEVGISDWEDRKPRKVIARRRCLARRYIMAYLGM